MTIILHWKLNILSIKDYCKEYQQTIDMGKENEKPATP